MTRELVSTDKAPAAVGPYSQAIRAGGLLYTSGQIALDPASGKLVAAGIREQTRQVLDNLKAVLQTAGVGFESVIKVTVFLKNMDDFAEMNQVYSKYFTAPYPARSTVEVAKLPRDSLVEIEVIALLKD